MIIVQYSHKIAIKTVITMCIGVSCANGHMISLLRIIEMTTKHNRVGQTMYSE